MTKAISALLGIAAALIPYAALSAQSKSPRMVQLTVTKEIPVKSFPGTTFALPPLCTSQGDLFIRPTTIDAVLDPVTISPEGQITARFGRESITGMQNADPLYAFTRDSDVYLLVSGAVQLDHEIELRTPTGQVLHQKAVEPSTRVAHFRSDGTFVDSFALSLPFTPSQLGEFASGDFLVTGTDRHAGESRAALVNAGGQLIRLIELKQRENSKSASSSSFSTFQIIPDGPNLLVFGNGTNTVFFVTAGAAVRALKLRVPDSFELEALASANGRLFVELTKDRKDGTGSDFSAYAIDRQSGITTVEYQYSRDFGFGMACTDGTDFTFLVLDPESKGVKILKLSPSNRRQ